MTQNLFSKYTIPYEKVDIRSFQSYVTKGKVVWSLNYMGWKHKFLYAIFQVIFSYL